MRKRIADFLEKFAVGSLLVGFYQESWFAVFVFAFAFAISLYFTKKGAL